MKKMKLSMTVHIMIGIAAGLLLGICLGDKVKDIKLIGDIFLRLIQMSVVVMIMGAVTESVANLDPNELGRFGVKMLFWFLLTTVLAAAAGAALGQFFLPGKGLFLPATDQIVQTSDKGLYNIILDFLPSNIVQSMANSNMIQVIIFSVLFGASLGSCRVKKGSSQLMGVIKEFNEVILGIVHKVMSLAPLGIGALLAYTAGTTGIKVIMPLIRFLLIFGCGSLLYLVLIIIFASFYCKTNPFNVGKKLFNMTIVAFTTTSSAVTLPTKMEESIRNRKPSWNDFEQQWLIHVSCPGMYYGFADLWDSPSHAPVNTCDSFVNVSLPGYSGSAWRRPGGTGYCNSCTWASTGKHCFLIQH